MPIMNANGLLQVQGNVLIAFPQDCQIFLFLNFDNTREPARWLAEIVPRVTATADLCGQDTFAQKDAVRCGVGFTAAGVSALSQAAGETLAQFAVFCQGAAARAASLRDDGPSAPENWVFGGPGAPPIHAVLLFAASACQAEILETEVARQNERAEKLGIRLVYRQDCGRLTGGLSDCEHFGFRDGISQPFVWRDENGGAVQESSLPVGEFVLDKRRADNAVQQCPSWMRNGSFQVIRRLRQDVASWRRQLDRIWYELGCSEILSRELIAAKLIGRWPSGTPLAIAAEHDTGDLLQVPFDFDGDPEGFVTPRFSHIRKMLPRISGFPERDWRRIIRRGVPFGPPYDDAPHEPDRGLLLNAYMANIADQFEFLIRSWANDPDFAEASDGPDPIIGRPAGPVTLRRRGAIPCPLHIENHVTTTGSVYLFVPAFPGLQLLATGLPPPRGQGLGPESASGGIL